MFSIVYAGRHPLTTGVSRHLHTTWELIFCTSGSGILTFDDRTISYSENDIVLIPPRIPHSNGSEEGFTNVHLNISEVPLPYTEPVIVQADSNGFLRDAFNAVYYFYTGNSDLRTILLTLYGQIICTFLKGSQASTSRSSVVLDIENNILDNYTNCSYDLHAYLRSLPFSPEYLTKLFKKQTGITPFQYLQQRRLENAADLLSVTYGRGNISDVARLCGFNDPLYFSRQFHKKYGVSPSDFKVEKSLDSDSMKTML